MVEMAPPLNARGAPEKRLVQVALGVFNYYRKFVCDFSRIAAPLVALTKDGATMVWTDVHKAAYAKLKAELAKEPVVMHPNYTLPFVLYTDASKVGVAGVLTQYRPIRELKGLAPGTAPYTTGQRKLADGQMTQEVVVGYYSRINSVQDAKLGATALECLDVVLAMNHFRPYLWGPVTCVTDAAALRWLRSLQSNDGKLLRFAMRLAEYDISRSPPRARQQQRGRYVTPTTAQ